jgi:hypothetical protein
LSTPTPTPTKTWEDERKKKKPLPEGKEKEEEREGQQQAPTCSTGQLRLCSLATTKLLSGQVRPAVPMELPQLRTGQFIFSLHPNNNPTLYMKLPKKNMIITIPSLIAAERPCGNPQCDECPRPRHITIGFSSSEQKATIISEDEARGPSPNPSSAASSPIF